MKGLSMLRCTLKYFWFCKKCYTLLDYVLCNYAKDFMCLLLKSFLWLMVVEPCKWTWIGHKESEHMSYIQRNSMCACSQRIWYVLQRFLSDCCDIEDDVTVTKLLSVSLCFCEAMKTEIIEIRCSVIINQNEKI